MYFWGLFYWDQFISRLLKRLFRRPKRTEVDPKLIQVLPHVPEFEKPFTIREQLKGMRDSLLPSPEAVAENVVQQGMAGLLFMDSFTATLQEMTFEDEQQALFINTEAFPRFDAALRRICKEKNVEVVTSTDQDLFMRITFRKLKG